MTALTHKSLCVLVAQTALTVLLLAGRGHAGDEEKSYNPNPLFLGNFDINRIESGDWVYCIKKHLCRATKLEIPVGMAGVVRASVGEKVLMEWYDGCCEGVHKYEEGCQADETTHCEWIKGCVADTQKSYLSKTRPDIEGWESSDFGDLNAMFAEDAKKKEAQKMYGMQKVECYLCHLACDDFEPCDADNCEFRIEDDELPCPECNYMGLCAIDDSDSNEGEFCKRCRGTRYVTMRKPVKGDEEKCRKCKGKGKYQPYLFGPYKMALKKKVVFGECAHHVCKECFASYIYNNVSRPIIRCCDLTCIESCEYEYSEEWIEKYASTQKYELRQRKMAEMKLGENFVCCPGKDCYGWVDRSKKRVLLSDVDHRMVSCQKGNCDLTFCVDCVEPWKIAEKTFSNCEYCCGRGFEIETTEKESRRGKACQHCNGDPGTLVLEAQTHNTYTCEEWAKLLVSEEERKSIAQTMKLVSKDSHRCPSCKHIITKNGGCQHMTCIECKTEYCEICFGPFIAAKKYGKVPPSPHAMGIYKFPGMCKSFDCVNNRSKAAVASGNIKLSPYVEEINGVPTIKASLEKVSAPTRRLMSRPSTLEALLEEIHASME